MRLGVFPLLIPIVVCTAIFAIATQLFGLSPRNWAIIAVGFAAIWYWLLWLGLRQVTHPGEPERSKDPGGRGAEIRSPRAGRLLRSPGGLLSAVLGSLLLVTGDRQLGVILLAVGALLLSLMQFRRR